MKQNLLFTIFLTFLFQFSYSQAVTLDNTFGTSGKVINSSITSGQTIQLQSSGKIVSCYISNYSTSGNIHLTRLNTDGSIDTSFGVNGFVNSILFTETGGVNMMRIQGDDKIIVTGNLNSGSGLDFGTARFNNDGTIDTSFGVNGYAVTDFGVFNEASSTTVEIQNDGAILIGGFVYQIGFDAAMVKYTPNGTIDNSFGTNGKFVYNFGTNTIPFSGGNSKDEIWAIRVNSIGKIILGIDTDVSESLDEHSNFGFICLNPNGTLDTGFGSNGLKVVDFGARDYFVNLKLTTDDKIIATGRRQYSAGGNNYTNMPLVKLLANGDYDSSFGNNGIVLTNRDASNTIDLCSDLIIQSDGKIICLGSTPDPTVTMGNFLLIRFNANGTIDTTFNGIGYKTVDFNNSSATGTTFLIQPDGKFLCAGSIDFTVGCLARLIIGDLANNSFGNKLFSVYPNPFSESITIENKDLNLINATAELYDISGRKLSEYHLENTTDFAIPMNEHMAKGNYLLKITSEGKTETIKIIKQ